MSKKSSLSPRSPRPSLLSSRGYLVLHFTFSSITGSTFVRGVGPLHPQPGAGPPMSCPGPFVRGQSSPSVQLGPIRAEMRGTVLECPHRPCLSAVSRWSQQRLAGPSAHGPCGQSPGCPRQAEAPAPTAPSAGSHASCSPEESWAGSFTPSCPELLLTQTWVCSPRPVKPTCAPGRWWRKGRRCCRAQQGEWAACA